MSRVVELPRTEFEQSLLDISDDQWDLYESMFIPIEDAWLDSIGKGGASAQEGQDIMSAEAAHTFAPLEQEAYQQSFAAGNAPNSGSFIGLASDLAIRKANATSEAMTAAVNEDTLDYYDQALTASQYGRGLGSESVTGLGSSGVRSANAERMSLNQDVFNQSASDAASSAIYDTLGTVGGIAAGYGLSKYKNSLKDTVNDTSSITVQGARGGTLSGRD